MLTKLRFGVPRLLYQAAQRALGVRASRVEEDAVTVRLRVGVDPLPYRAGRVAAAHGERLDQEMGERM